MAAVTFWIVIGIAVITGLTQLFAFIWIVWKEADVFTELRENWKHSVSFRAKIKTLLVSIGVMLWLVIMILFALASARSV